MSADMLTAHITTRTTNPEDLDWDAAKAALARIDSTEPFRFYDPENDAEKWLDTDDDRDVHLEDGTLDLQVLKDIASGILGQLREELSGRGVDVITMGGTTAFISGGLSWGDAPSDACDVIWAAHALPLSVLHAAGLSLDELDEEAPLHALSSRTPVQIMADFQSVSSPEDEIESLVGEVVDSVRDAYALALRDPDLRLNPLVITRIETTVADAVSNNWF